ncbi:MAG: DM13 domain-containing protein [Acidimicrobiia bacterium]
MSTKRLAWLGGGLVAFVMAFLLFRPDTLFTDVEADESLSDAFATTSSSKTTSSTTVTPATTAAAAAATTTSAAEPSTTTSASLGPIAIATGSFYGINHDASGTATIYESDGRFVLRFEDDTNIQNGPDLYVWVLPALDYEGGSPTDYLDLGTLTGNVGGQNYDLPSEFDPEVHRAVLIWCLRFDVPFAAVPLQ